MRKIAAFTAVWLLIGFLGTPTQALASQPACLGMPATIVGTSAGETLIGTPRSDVIVALGGEAGQGVRAKVAVRRQLETPLPEPTQQHAAELPEQPRRRRCA